MPTIKQRESRYQILRSIGSDELSLTIHFRGAVTHYRPHKERQLVKTVRHYDDGSEETE